MQFTRLYRNFTPAALADMRTRYVETREPIQSIVADYGIGKRTFHHFRAKEAWPRRIDRVIGLPPDIRLKLEAESAVRAHVEKATDDPALLIADRLEKAIEKELAAVEYRRMTFGQEPEAPADAERTVRTLERLTQTLFKVRRLRLPDEIVSAQVASSDLPKDADEFRRALARRIRELFQSRCGGGTSSPTDAGAATPSE